jgi:cell wall-associated NlpC family hydrolase
MVGIKRGITLLGIMQCFSFALPNSDYLLITALSFMDRGYRFGSEDAYAMDCSAFVQKVFRINGIQLPRSTREQAQYGSPVKREDIKPGDLLFFRTYAPYPSHVGIYIGNGKMIHASTTQGIVISRIDEPYWKVRFLFARRVLKDQKQEDDIKDIILESLRDKF